MMPLHVGPLVRATTASSAVIWAEFFQPCHVTLNATAVETSERSTISISTQTVTVGGRHYATPQLTGLQPATWYSYHFETSVDQIGQTQEIAQSQDISSQTTPPYQCFRTLDAQAS